MNPPRFKKIKPPRKFIFWVTDRYGRSLPYGAKEIAPGVFEVRGGSRPYRTTAKSCDCEARKKPCRHTTGIIQILAESPVREEAK